MSKPFDRPELDIDRRLNPHVPLVLDTKCTRRCARCKIRKPLKGCRLIHAPKQTMRMVCAECRAELKAKKDAV